MLRGRGIPGERSRGLQGVVQRPIVLGFLWQLLVAEVVKLVAVAEALVLVVVFVIVVLNGLTSFKAMWGTSHCRSMRFLESPVARVSCQSQWSPMQEAKFYSIEALVPLALEGFGLPKHPRTSLDSC